MKILSLESVGEHLKQSAVIQFKALARDNWGPSEYEPNRPILTDEDKAFVKQNIVELLIHSPPKIRFFFFYCLLAV